MTIAIGNLTRAQPTNICNLRARTGSLLAVIILFILADAAEQDLHANRFARME